MGLTYLDMQPVSKSSMFVHQKSLVANVMYVGDSGVGKTSLAKGLISTQSQRVKVTNITEWQSNSDISIEQPDNIQPYLSQSTSVVERRFLEMQVKLLTGVKLEVDWTDTPGIIWRSQWQQANSSEWDKIKALANNSKAIVVVLPPYRDLGAGIGERELVELHKIPNRHQWCHRFERWVRFFLEDCPDTEHIILCINKADLFCDIELEANLLAYNPSALTMDWVDRHNYVINKYFSSIEAAIAEINHNRYGLVVRCFITSIYNRTLLDLPWIYLASYL